MKYSDDEKWIEVEAADPYALITPTYPSWRICTQCYAVIQLAWLRNHEEWHDERG